MGDVPSRSHFAHRHLRIAIGNQGVGVILAQLTGEAEFHQRRMHQARHNRIAADVFAGKGPSR